MSQESEAQSESAFTDGLTHLPNRRHARVYLENEFARALEGRPLAVVFFQLDAHAASEDEDPPAVEDEAVRALAHVLAETTRKSNLSARWAGQAFLTVLSGSDAEGGLAFAERVRARVAASQELQPALTVSAGVAAFHAGLDSAQDLLAEAETALTEARVQGPNRVRARSRRRRPLPAQEAPGGGTRIGQGRTLLLVEDDESVRTALAAFLMRHGFRVTEAGDATQALWELREEFDVLVTDIRLPGATGTELVSALKSRWPATPALVITGMKDAQVAAEALNAGADRYLFKPFGLDEFEVHLSELLARRERTLRERRERHLLSHQARERAEQARLAVLRGARALVTAVEVRDPYTRGHSIRVSGYAQILAGAADEDEVDLESLRLACELHDVGKIGVPDAILNKEDRLTDAEYDEVRRHPLTGRRILEPLLSDDTILSVVSWHHERWDGQGYPDGLAEEGIPLVARIVGVADALDAMTSTRAYRRALPWGTAVSQIRDLSGTQFDPALVRAFERVLPALSELHHDLEA